MKKIISVSAEKIINQKGRHAGYRYFANFEDGSREVIRAKATRLYENAFRISESHGVSGNGNASGLAKWFCFGKNPNQWVRDGVIERFSVQASE